MDNRSEILFRFLLVISWTSKVCTQSVSTFKVCKYRGFLLDIKSVVSLIKILDSMGYPVEQN